MNNDNNQNNGMNNDMMNQGMNNPNMMDNMNNGMMNNMNQNPNMMNQGMNNPNMMNNNMAPENKTSILKNKKVLIIAGVAVVAIILLVVLLGGGGASAKKTLKCTKHEDFAGYLADIAMTVKANDGEIAYLELEIEYDLAALKKSGNVSDVNSWAEDSVKQAKEDCKEEGCTIKSNIKKDVSMKVSVIYDKKGIAEQLGDEDSFKDMSADDIVKKIATSLESQSYKCTY